MNRTVAGYTCWAHGRIWPLLDPHMQEVYWAFRRATARKFVFDCARKFGKSTIMLACAFEDAMQIKKAQIKYGAATHEAVGEILIPLVEYLLDGRGDKALACPPKWQPKWIARRQGYRFPDRELHTNHLALLEACRELGCTDEHIAFERERLAATPANDNSALLSTGTELLDAHSLEHKRTRRARPSKEDVEAQDDIGVHSGGSFIKLVGCDMYPNRLRGPVMHAGYLDEAAFIEKLEYVVQNVLWHMMQGITGSRILMGSTPPESPGHAWTTRYVVEAKAAGAYIHRTIRDNTRLTAEEIESEIQEAGGPLHSNCKRELFAQHVTDETLAVIPEFADAKERIIEERQRPDYFDWYLSMDPAFKDLTAIIAGYWDFRNQILVIEHEAALERPNTEDIANAIREIEECYDTNPLRRISDVELRLISDLWTQHGLVVVQTAKDDKDVAIAGLRLLIQSHRIRINPRCKGVLAHLEHAIWRKSKKSFERSGQYGHFDYVDALIYMTRNLDKGRNPYPRYLHGESPETHKMQSRNPRAKSREGAVVLDLFKRRTA